MSAIKNVLVAGGASNIGPPILAALHKASFTISVLKRPDSSAIYPSYVTPIETDFSPASLLSAFNNQDAVISALGFDGIAHQIKMIDAAEQAGVKRFVPSEFGWSKDLPMVPELAAKLEPKVKSYDYLVKKCAESPTMSWSVVASGVFFDWCIKKVPTMGFVLPKHSAKIYDSGKEPFSCTTSTAIGTAVAGLLLCPEETANRYLKISSFKTTQNQLLTAFEEITNSKWDVTRVTTKQILEERMNLVKQKQFQEVFMGVVAVQLFEDGSGRGVTVEVENSDNDLLGVKEENVVDVLKVLI